MLHAIMSCATRCPGNSGAHLVLLECTPAEGVQETMSARVWIDIHMLVLVDGKERTASQWKTLFSAVGFKLISVTETRSAMKVIEAISI